MKCKRYLENNYGLPNLLSKGNSLNGDNQMIYFPHMFTLFSKYISLARPIRFSFEGGNL